MWFYRKWTDGYKAFNQATKQAFADGHVYTASFDLTACYDSLDHRVLKHFLGKLGFDLDFCTKLAEWLEKWTATGRGIWS
jgi:IS1 family transposase